MDDLISRAAAIDAIVSVTAFPDADYIKNLCQNPANSEDWLGGVCDAINAVEEVNAVDAVPVDFLMRYAQLPTEFAIAAWQKPNKELMKQKAKSYDKPMFFEEALQVVNNEYGERRDGET